MYISTHNAIVLFGILLLESSALFVYTLIGLIKSNPMPFMVPPAPQFPAYQYGPPPMLQLPPAAATTHTKVITTTVSKVMVVQPGEYGANTFLFPGDPPALTVSTVKVSTTGHETEKKSSSTSHTPRSTSKSSSSSHSASSTPKSTSSSSSVKVVYVTSTAKPPSKKPVVVWVTSTVKRKT